jgi:Cu-Zn family superoxide dismutase
MDRKTTDEGGHDMAIRQALVAVWAALAVLAMVTAGAAAGTPTGASHAGGTFVDANGEMVGWVRLVEDGTGSVHVNVHVAGLTPGLHGIHVHAIGACAPTFAAAGGHYNPLGHEHGLENPAGAHAGDLPNLIVNANGVGHLDTTTTGVTILPGPTTLFDATVGAVGSAFIIHANEDDQVTNATNGNSGARVACAVIEAE